jgi:hypothetical protein
MEGRFEQEPTLDQYLHGLRRFRQSVQESIGVRFDIVGADRERLANEDLALAHGVVQPICTRFPLRRYRFHSERWFLSPVVPFRGELRTNSVQTELEFACVS